MIGNRLFAAMCLILVGASAAQAGNPTEQLHILFDDYHEWKAGHTPDSIAEPGALSPFGLRDLERREEQLRAFRDRLERIDPAGFDEEDRISHAIFEHLLLDKIGAIEHERYHFPLAHTYGIHLGIPHLGAAADFKQASEIEAYLDRLEELPRYIDDVIDHLRRGMERGRTLPRCVVQHVPEQIDDVIENHLSNLAAPIEWAWRDVAEADLDELWERCHLRTLPRVADGLRNLRAFLTDHYLPNCRETIGLSEIPGGAAFYRHHLAVLTTTSASPEELRGRGRALIDELRPELAQAIRATDFAEDLDGIDAMDDAALIAAFRDFIEEKPRFRFDCGETLLTAWRDQAKQVDLWLPMFFQSLPRTPFGITDWPGRIVHDSRLVTYLYGDIEQKHAGAVYINTGLVDHLYTFELIPLVLHEGMPGHHLEISLARERADRPLFRRTRQLPVFGEGWSTYAESLGKEMHLYTDPYDEVGRLHLLMVRACRLTLDPSIHAFGWSRDMAEDVLRANTLLDEKRMTTEIDRIITWPGQPTTYMVSKMKILELRERAEKAMGEAFDIREFHDVVLLAGAIPLPVLERRIDEWIEGERDG